MGSRLLDAHRCLVRHVTTRTSDLVNVKVTCPSVEAPYTKLRRHLRAPAFATVNVGGRTSVRTSRKSNFALSAAELTLFSSGILQCLRRQFAEGMLFDYQTVAG